MFSDDRVSALVIQRGLTVNRIRSGSAEIVDVKSGTGSDLFFVDRSNSNYSSVIQYHLK